MTRIDRSWRASSAASSRPVIRGISMSVSTIVRPGRGPATARGARRPAGHDLDVRLGPTATARTSPGVAEGAGRNSRLPLAVVLDRWRPRSKGRGRTARLPRRSGHDRAGSLKSGVSRLPGTAPARRPPDRLGGRAAREPLPSGTASTRIRGAGRRTRGPRIRPGGVAPPPGGP